MTDLKRGEFGKGRRIACILTSVLAAAAMTAGAETFAILQDGDISAWQERRFHGRTVYKAASVDGRTGTAGRQRGIRFRSVPQSPC